MCLLKKFQCNSTSWVRTHSEPVAKYTPDKKGSSLELRMLQCYETEKYRNIMSHENVMLLLPKILPTKIIWTALYLIELH